MTLKIVLLGQVSRMELHVRLCISTQIDLNPTLMIENSYAKTFADEIQGKFYNHFIEDYERYC